jgi:hypothetical protein
VNHTAPDANDPGTRIERIRACDTEFAGEARRSTTIPIDGTPQVRQ